MALSTVGHRHTLALPMVRHALALPTVRHALQHIQETHEQALDLGLVQFVTANHGISQRAARLVLKGNAGELATPQCTHISLQRKLKTTDCRDLVTAGRVHKETSHAGVTHTAATSGSD